MARPAASGGPDYQRIASDLRERIRRGQLAPGAQIPTEAELMEQYGKSRSTVRNALVVLRSAGLVEGGSTRGNFVREHHPLTITATRYERERGATANDAYKDEVEAQGRRHKAELTLVILPATQEIANRLNVEIDTLVACRREILYLDDRPNAIQMSYYPMDIAGGTELAKKEDIPRGTIRVLKELGHEEVGHRDEVSPRMPTEEEERDLQLGAGVPILEWIRTAYSNEGPVRLTWRIYAGSGVVLVYELGDTSVFASPS